MSATLQIGTEKHHPANQSCSSINVTINAAQDIDITIGDGLKDSLNNVISQVQCQSKRTKRVPGLDTECRQRVETAILDLIMGTPLQGNAGALARVPRRDAPPADDYGFLMASVLPFGTANLIELQKAVLLAVTIAEEVVIRAVEIELTRLQLQLLDTTFRILGEWLEDKKGECPANAPIGINAVSISSLCTSTSH